MAQRGIAKKGLASKIAQLIVTTKSKSIPYNGEGALPNQISQNNSLGSLTTISNNETKPVDFKNSNSNYVEKEEEEEEEQDDDDEKDLFKKDRSKLIGSRRSQEYTKSAFESVGLKSSLDPIELKQIPISEARRYRTSSISCPLLLNQDELNNILPSRRLSIYVATFNMAGKDIVDHQIQDWIFPEASVHTADIYAIALQEGAPECSAKDFRLWEKRLQCCLSPCKQVLIRSVWMGVQHLAVFIRRELVWFVSDSKTYAINTRPISNVRTKGAVGIWLKFFGTTFLFISCHLSHGPDILPRLCDCKRIQNFFEARTFPTRKGNLLDESDYVFWFGDMNFRLSIDDIFVDKLKDRQPSENDILFLLDRDQLIDAIKEGKALETFLEKDITFLPTYKLIIGSSTYATNIRWPAYTDRIVYRVNKREGNNDMDCLVYDSIPVICSSDHKPIYGIFKATVSPEMQTARREQALSEAKDKIKNLQYHLNEQRPKQLSHG